MSHLYLTVSKFDGNVTFKGHVGVFLTKIVNAKLRQKDQGQGKESLE